MTSEGVPKTGEELIRGIERKISRLERARGGGVTQQYVDDHKWSAADLTSGTIGDARLPARLGAVTQSVSGDWNNVIEAGWYNGASLTNSPIPSTWLYMEVIVHRNTTDKHVKQICYEFFGDRMWTRRMNSDTWSAWVEMAKVGDIPRGVIPASIAVGSGSASVDANGLITFTGVSRLSLNGVFPDIAGSKFRLDWRCTNTAAGAVYCRMRNAGTDSVAGYNYIGAYYNYGTGWTKYQSFGTSLFGYMWPNPVANAPAVTATMTLDQPGTTAATGCHVVGLVAASDRYRIDEYGESYGKMDGISIFAGAGTMTGTMKIVRIA